MTLAPLSWFGIVRLGLVQTALGAIFVLSTSTLNRVMVVELALPAALPGFLIALHYAMQLMRPWLGHGSDIGGRRTPYIIGGMALLSLGGLGAAGATGLMSRSLAAGIALAVPSFLLIGLGVGASGTALLVLLAKRTAPERRPAAATIAWVMMIAGFIVTAAIAGHFLDPFSPGRLFAVAAALSSLAFIVSVLAVWGIEGGHPPSRDTSLETSPDASLDASPLRAVPPVGDPAASRSDRFAAALKAVWQDPQARRFAIFIFVSMLAYGGEDLLIEPFAGATFGMTPGATAKLAGFLHGGALAGMVLVALAGSALRRWRLASLEAWMVGGCVGSATALVAIAAVGVAAVPGWLPGLLFVLGIANGTYAIAAIGSMMQRVGSEGGGHEGIRMGLWGAAQAVAFGGGGVAATVSSDLARHWVASTSGAYAAVFLGQAAVFLYAATLAASLGRATIRQLRVIPSA